MQISTYFGIKIIVHNFLRYKVKGSHTTTNEPIQRTLHLQPLALYLIPSAFHLSHNPHNINPKIGAHPEVQEE